MGKTKRPAMTEVGWQLVGWVSTWIVTGLIVAFVGGLATGVAVTMICHLWHWQYAVTIGAFALGVGAAIAVLQIWSRM